MLFFVVFLVLAETRVAGDALWNQTSTYTDASILGSTYMDTSIPDCTYIDASIPDRGHHVCHLVNCILL